MTDIPNSSISAQLAALPSLPMADLWALWDQHFPRRPNHRNRHYVESRLAYRIQELAYGALPGNLRKMLVEAGAKHSRIKTAAGRGAQTLAGVAAWPAVHVRRRTAGAQLHEEEGQDLPLLQPDQAPALGRVGQPATVRCLPGRLKSW